MWAPNKREWRLNLKRNKFFGFQLLRASAWMSFPLMEFYTFTIREEQEKEYDTAFDWFLDLWLALARGKKGKLLRVLLSGRWLPGNQGWLNFWETRRFLLLDLCTGRSLRVKGNVNHSLSLKIYPVKISPKLISSGRLNSPSHGIFSLEAGLSVELGRGNRL